MIGRLKRLLNQQWKIAFLGILFCSQLAHSELNPRLRDPRQFIFGFEPTKTNLPIVLESLGAVIKKVVTGKGEGVLSADLPVSTKYRERFLEQMKKDCPACKIIEARESHGELSYHIEFPDEFYIRSSLDAGALEWQTKPSSIPEIEAHVPLLQEQIFDRAKKIGVNMNLEALGGHTTFSGFGDDTFWYGNYLKFRTKHTYLDWGFFGKDSYNATPVSLWDPKQQAQYEKVHLEHDQKWKKFLVQLENGLENHIPDTELMKIYQNRDLMKQEEYSAKLLEIYHNPKLENKMLGKRSKPKYVANKPLRNLIENRAIRPQKSAEELLRMAEFIEAEAWYVKEQMNQGLEVPFKKNSFVDKSRKEIVRSTKKMVESLGLKWENYVGFSKAGDAKLAGSEKELIEDFTRNDYGAKKRDALFKKLRDHFYFKREPLTAAETVFMADLLNEMSYTIPQSIENAELMKSKITPAILEKLSAEEFNKVVSHIAKFEYKFPKASQEILKPVQEHLLAYAKRSLNDVELVETRRILPLMEDQSVKKVLNQVEGLHQKNPMRGQSGLYADLVLHPQSGEGNLKKYLESVTKKYQSNAVDLPERFNEVILKAEQFEGLSQSSNEATDAVAKWVSQNSATLKVSGEDSGMLKWLAEQHPEHSKEILKPLRNHYSQVMKENEYGLKNFYKTSATFDFLSEITPQEDKLAFLNETLTKVKSMHQIKNDTDSAAFIERVERHLAKYHQNLASTPLSVGSGSCIPKWLGQLKGIFRP